jgi:Spy/CpxP family protein refolding chaperone
MSQAMWSHLRKPLLALSLGLNLAFIAIWLAHAAPDWIPGPKAPEKSADATAVPSALHRDIGVTPDQWKQIAPIIHDFREKAGKQRQMITSLRGQLMDLLAMPVVDETDIRSKQEEILDGQRQMQNLVIGHLLAEKAILSPHQAEKLMHSLCEHCRPAGGMVMPGGAGRLLDGHLREGAMDKETLK